MFMEFSDNSSFSLKSSVVEDELQTAASEQWASEEAWRGNSKRKHVISRATNPDSLMNEVVTGFSRVIGSAACLEARVFGFLCKREILSHEGGWL